MALVSAAGGAKSPAAPSPRKGSLMRSYTVQINGITTTLRLTEKTAAARGLVADTDPADEVAAEVPAKAKKPANKKRTPANKARAEIAAMAFGATESEDED